MHQGHNIPWNILSTNFKFVKEDRRFTPPLTGVVSKRDPAAPGQIKHFVHKSIHAIQTFSETERAKYPPQFTSLTSGPLFRDDLLDKYPEYLNRRNQRIEHWIARAATTGNGHFHTSHGDLADVVKVLLYENQMETLLMLAQHPSIPLGDLHNLSWGHHFGFSRVGESAARAYLFFNCAEAVGILESGEYALTRDYYFLLQEIGASMDYPAQQIPHVNFLRECGILSEGDSRCYGPKEDANKSFVHTDYRRLQEYLKELFALMYRYDMLVRECGLDANWEGELSNREPIRQHAKLDYVNGEYKVVYE
ncbi:hypothetical protein CVT26_007480 [Gymnopilus dilepis]|uniref:Uncharacterized protein n=1 Tax=Gymnopilus dilepis TaxID=231916 RepID=A0A409WSF2_9AGAR|nr:hypothetical protein CVT26_007480 [Gymnopilus dilepis]